MNPELVQFFSEIGKITGDQSVSRGIVTSVGVAAIVLATGWKMLRSKKPERIIVSINAPPGEKLLVQLGDDNKEP